MFQSIIRYFKKKLRVSNSPSGIIDVAKNDSPLDTDHLEKAGEKLHSSLIGPDSRWESHIQDIASLKIFLIVSTVIGLGFGLITQVPLELVQFIIKRVFGVDGSIIMSAVRETKSPQTIALWRVGVRAFTGILLGGIAGFVVWLASPQPGVERASRGQLAFHVSSTDTGHAVLHPRYIADDTPLLNLKGAIQMAHSSNVELNNQDVSDNPSGLPENAEGQRTERAILTREIGMRETKPKDSYQQGLSASEAAPVDSDDTGLPIDEIGRLLSAYEVPLHYQLVVRSLKDSDEASDEYIADLSEQDHVGHSNPGDKHRKENVRRDTPRNFFHLNIRLIAYLDPQSDHDRQLATQAMDGITSEIESVLPEYVTTFSKDGYTQSLNPLSRLRAKRIRADISNRTFRKDRPSKLKAIVGGQSRRNIILGSSSIWGLLAIPGAGLPETRRGFDIVPRDQWPTGQPTPSFQQEIEAEYDPHNTAKSGKSAADTD